ncbi:MAG TPA: ABC transporter permease [Candidatus Cybelea sp.]|nr:ABC transporter permease [Candidatus Cybelea sp.]
MAGQSNGNGERVFRIAAPAVVGAIVLALWEALIRHYEVPVYILPGPVAIGETFWQDGGSLFASLLVTLRTALVALAAAAIIGALLAILLAEWRWLELSVFPYAVALQVTPIVAIAPLIIILVNDTFLSLLICAWIVSFFPVLSNTTFGLKSVDPNLDDLFRLYGATRLQRLAYLRLPTALPHYLGGLRISGGLALIGAVVAEFVASTGGSETGIAWRIQEAGYRLQIPRMFAALLLLAAAGIVLFLVLTWISNRLLRHWHESALPKER